MSLRRLLFFITVLGPSVASGSAFAQGYENAALQGFGGARRALGQGAVAVWVNPAGLALRRNYDVELGYADDLRDADRRINLTLADGQAGPIAGAIAFTYERFRPLEEMRGDRRLEGVRLDIAAAVQVQTGLAIGFIARFADYRLLDGDENISGGGSSAFSFDAGMQWAIGGGFALGATIENFTAANTPGIPRAWGAGLGYRSGPLSFEIDIDHEWEQSDPEYTGALGFIVAERIPLRAAASYLQETDEFALSFGAGLNIDQFGFDVAYRQIISPNGDARDADARLLTFGIRGTVR